MGNKKLHEKIIQQNEELKRINENLEEMVQNRTKDLEIQNQALELSRAILDDLPIPIIGVSSDGMIVMLNNKAMRLSYNQISMEVGREISDYFSNEVKEKITDTINTNTIHAIKEYRFSEETYSIYSGPLSGKFQGKGIVMVLKPVEK